VTDPDRALDLIYVVGLLVLVTSALVARRIPMRQGLKMAGAWLLIFAGAFLILAAKDDLVVLGKGLWGQTDSKATIASAEPVRIRKSADGHFWVDGRVNGQAIRFLVDSGATVTSLSTAAADRARVDYHGGFPALVETANGMVPVQRGRATTLKIGSIVRTDLAVQVSSSLGDANVLGMNFLSTLKGWGVEGEWLILKA
jgi:aspartyl protease family protein